MRRAPLRGHSGTLAQANVRAIRAAGTWRLAKQEKGRGCYTPALLEAIRFHARSGADHPDRVEIHGHLAIGVHGEVRVFLEKRPRPIRSVRYGFMEVGIDLYEQVAVFDPLSAPFAPP